MSRTKKDAPPRVRFPDYGLWSNEDAYKRTKKRRKDDTEWHWLQSTPSWWNNLFHTRPRRRATHLWEHEVVKTPIEELDEVDTPNESNKPHKYYW